MNTLKTFLFTITGFFSTASAKKNFIQVKDEANYSYFQSSVNDLLTYDIMSLTQYKKHLYQKFIDALTEQDKMQVISYYRINKDAKFENEYENLQQQMSIHDTQTSYSYLPNKSKKQWHVNFADQHLFGFYNTNLFAQDEIQCAEHPLLSHVRSAAQYLGNRVAPLTIENGPTPILIKDVHRLGFVNIMPTKENRNGIYGNNFAKASLDYIDRMSQQIINDKPLTNFIAMAALGYGSGTYQTYEIEFLFQTAKNSFSLAKELSGDMEVELHTGNWGCGAFGNNRQLIASIQLFAAHLSGIENIVYHTFDEQGKKGFEQGKKIYENFLRDIKINNCESPNFQLDQQFIMYLSKQNFQWGYSDGN
ncbi:poly (ADP-ribose) glycohydrolase (macronuclear) [Tetrahymena thermophila SB210]|uniref:Poly (ADP-ribose) glycohydrolase n=1 Tax=Tetrahymena thermophila (strain SB210) TaxID=312017 RepID=Q22F10_TETTS|nr:poly (ADP-ribose) glycohydrolase [Tetrahymena thermophila SB210]EAR83865.2 poly (ADP-ribose) glycohydrolase [Tetrahymena thermophila SB210]|eukprot:XP_001031528.2 poly (ADP-ribose) glycohydrolase [Tetrahymena thermophila SB210]